MPSLLPQSTEDELREQAEFWQGEFEIMRKAAKLWEEASNSWMDRALKAEAKLTFPHIVDQKID